jgi:hypothetical protein
LKGHTGAVTHAAFSPDGRSIASTSTEGSIRLWDVAARRQAASIPIPRDIYFAVSFAPDSRTLAVIGQGPVLTWDIPNGKPAAVPDSIPSI